MMTGRKLHITYKSEYRSWSAMKQRCDNQNAVNYDYYGGRGIRYCDDWSKFDMFLNDMGRKPTTQHTIDRIDSDGDYSPDNCKWSLMDEQARNRRSTIKVEHDGATFCLSDFAKEMGVGYSSLYQRMTRKNETPHEAAEKLLRFSERREFLKLMKRERRPQMTSDEQTSAVALYRSGKTCSEIAAMFQRSTECIRHLVKRTSDQPS